MRYTYKEWVDQRTSEKVFTSCYECLDDSGKAKCDARMMYLRDQPPANWVDPHAKKLASNLDEDCKGIYEIRFKANRLQQRPMGYFSEGEFIIVLWVTHKESYSTRNYCTVARERWNAICAGTAQTIEIEID